MFLPYEHSNELVIACTWIHYYLLSICNVLNICCSNSKDYVYFSYSSAPYKVYLCSVSMKSLKQPERHISICFHPSYTLSISSFSFKKQNKTKTKQKRNHHHFLSTKQAVELQLSCFFHVTLLLLLRLLKSNMIWKQVGQPSQGLVTP